MEIKSKQKFIQLLLGAMAASGTLVDNFDFKEEIFEIMQDRRFSPLFSFFKSRKDFDFTKELNPLVRENFISYHFLENGRIVIEIHNKMFEDLAFNVLRAFDPELIKLMILFLRENSLSEKLSGVLKNGIKAKHSLVNPNGAFSIGENMRIISNGAMEEIKEDSILVENASFTVIEKLKDGEVIRFELLYPFEGSSYIFNIVQNISNMDTPIEYYKDVCRPDIVRDREKFQEIKRARVFRYNVL